MRAGALCHRVVFRSPVLTPDGQGGSAATFPTATFTMRCSVEALSGQEALAAGGQLTTSGLYRVVVRARSGISVQQRADVTYFDTGETVSLQVQRVERADDGLSLNVYCTAVEA
jgi:head-tail adaptor